jgi:hypothetical protein
MRSVHRIRLRDPWQRELLGDHVLWRRHFGKPRGLTAAEQVWLVLEGFPADVRVVLNGRQLSFSGDSQFDVTYLLGDRNQVELQISIDHRAPDRLPGLVVVEIR